MGARSAQGGFGERLLNTHQTSVIGTVNSPIGDPVLFFHKAYQRHAVGSDLLAIIRESGVNQGWSPVFAVPFQVHDDHSLLEVRLCNAPISY